MDFSSVVQNRHSVRDYTVESIGQAQVERLIKTAILAPSAMNLQPWAFAVLLDRERIAKYAKRAKEWLLANLSKTTFGEPARHMLGDPKFVLFYGAPALVLVMSKSSETQAMEDCCLAAGSLILAARNENLGSCWVGFARPWLNLEPTKQELGLPKQYQIVAPIVLGHPKAWPAPHGRNAPEIHWLAAAEVGTDLHK